MNEGTTTVSVAGGDARVSIYAADVVLTIDSDASLLAAADELAGDQVGLIVLGTTSNVEAVLSERDVVKAIAEGLDPLATPAMAVASKKIVWCDADATVREAVELMMEHYVRHVLLEHRGRLAGIVSARDLLGAYAMPAPETPST
jgi:CBS domain-containing protein